MSTLGFSAADFAVFEVEGFNERMEQIYARVRPRLLRLGDELAPELARRLHLEFFPHVARHARRTVNPPPETWAAFGPSPKGYKRYGYLALCVSGAGMHARVVVKPEADKRSEMGAAVRAKRTELARALQGTPIAHYETWDYRNLPVESRARADLFDSLADALGKKTGHIDLGFGWKARDAARLERDELLDAFKELEPLYRVLRSVA